MSTVSKCHTIRIEARSHANDLVAHTNTEDRSPPFNQRGTKLVNRRQTMLRVTRPIRQKEAIVSITDRVEIVIPWQDRNRCTAPHESAHDVGLGTKVEHCDPNIAGRVKHVWLFS